jgi:hypothetical protein
MMAYDARMHKECLPRTAQRRSRFDGPTARLSLPLPCKTVGREFYFPARGAKACRGLDRKCLISGSFSIDAQPISTQIRKFSLRFPVQQGKHRDFGTTNAAYGGPDRRTLYITESETGTILSARLEVPGKEMYSHV